MARLTDLIKLSPRTIKIGLRVDEGFAVDDEILEKLGRAAVAVIDERLNAREFVEGEPAVIALEEIAVSLAGVFYENPGKFHIPKEMRDLIDDYYVVPGW